MHPLTAIGESRLLLWQRVREYAVPPPMIESATARRIAGDWAGACAAAHVDVDLDLRAIARAHGRELAAEVRADLRRLAPDLLRWHMPRIAPEGLLRPGLTISLASYDSTHGVQLVVRTPPSWADAGQRIDLAWWDGARSSDGTCPHPRPDRRFRLDLHRHLWDAHRAGELRERAGVGGPPALWDSNGLVPNGIGCAVDRWAGEAAILLRSQSRDSDTVMVRLGSRRRLLLHVGDDDILRVTAAGRGGNPAWPELPDAATWVLPDLALLQSGLIATDRLHPLVAAALVDGHAPGRAEAPAHPPAHDHCPARSAIGVGYHCERDIDHAPGCPQGAAHRLAVGDAGGEKVRLVQCRGAGHRIGLVDGELVALDHDEAEIRREALLVALGGPPLPCLRVIDETHRQPECLAEIDARLNHGDFAGALAAVESLLGRDVLLRGGALRDALENAADRRIAHGLYRAGLAGHGPLRLIDDSELSHRPRSSQRHAANH
ncbi:MAG TPA: hypothetical protein VFC19_17530 [Candidatus Limnocylindrales bacterium]|nr:hypothetical protein [Candidatus Limnocylindrales bacterium]